MAVSKLPEPFTYQDYVHLPDRGQINQIIDGELFMTPAPTTRHQRISRKLVLWLSQFVEAGKLGEIFDAPCDVVLSPTNVVQPDLIFVSRERRHIITEKNIQGAPDLLVEILSESTAKIDRQFKRKLYASSGVKEYWLVDPEAETVEVLILAAKRYRSFGIFSADQLLKSPLLAGLDLPLANIFADPT